MMNTMKDSVEDLLERLQILDAASCYIENLNLELDKLEKKDLIYDSKDIKFDFKSFRQNIKKADKYLPDNIAAIDNAKQALGRSFRRQGVY